MRLAGEVKQCVRRSGSTRVVCSDLGADSAVRYAAAVGAAQVTIVIERNVDDSSGARVDVARKRSRIVVPEASGARMGTLELPGWQDHGKDAIPAGIEKASRSMMTIEIG